MIKIYHNPRCRKSREALQILEESGKPFKTIQYMKDVPSHEELQSIIELLAITPIELVRRNERVWKDIYKNKSLNDEDIITAMVENPKLIERPIVINNNKAMVGRPPEKILQIL